MIFTSLMSGKSWFDCINVHPAADLFPMMIEPDLSALAKDIAEKGLGVGIVLWAPKQPIKGEAEEIYLVDGRNRLAAIALAFQNAEQRSEPLCCAIEGGNDATISIAEPIISKGQPTTPP